MPGRHLLALLGAPWSSPSDSTVHLLKAPLLALFTTALMALAAFLFVGSAAISWAWWAAPTIRSRA